MRIQWFSKIVFIDDLDQLTKVPWLTLLALKKGNQIISRFNLFIYNLVRK